MQYNLITIQIQPITQKAYRLQPNTATQYAFLHENAAVSRICPLTVSCLHQLFYCMRFRYMPCAKGHLGHCHFLAATFLPNMEMMWPHNQTQLCLLTVLPVVISLSLTSKGTKQHEIIAYIIPRTHIVYTIQTMCKVSAV